MWPAFKQVMVPDLSMMPPPRPIIILKDSYSKSTRHSTHKSSKAARKAFRKDAKEWKRLGNRQKLLKGRRNLAYDSVAANAAVVSRMRNALKDSKLPIQERVHLEDSINRRARKYNPQQSSLMDVEHRPVWEGDTLPSGLNYSDISAIGNLGPQSERGMMEIADYNRGLGNVAHFEDLNQADRYQFFHGADDMLQLGLLAEPPRGELRGPGLALEDLQHSMVSYGPPSGGPPPGYDVSRTWRQQSRRRAFENSNNPFDSNFLGL